MILLSISTIKKEHPLYAYMTAYPSTYYQFTDGKADFVIVSLEDPTSQQRLQSLLDQHQQLFVYFEHWGSFTSDLSVEFIDQLLNSPYFCGFITHSSSTLQFIKDSYPQSKSYFLPVGVQAQSKDNILKRINSQRPLHFMFWSSWNDINNNNFYGRGGFYADEIFFRVRQQIDAFLTIRSPVSLKSQQHFPQSVMNVSSYLPQAELFNLCADNDVYLLPACQAHFITVPEAMSFGMPVVGSHSWGFEENVTDQFNGIRENCVQNWEICRQRESMDYNYIDRIVTRLLNMKKEELSINALEYQQKEHNSQDYPNRIEIILYDR